MMRCMANSYQRTNKMRNVVNKRDLHFLHVSRPEIKAPFTRYRFHFISDCLTQSEMKISPVYTMPFSFHSGLGFWRPIRYGMKTVSCKQKANPIWNQSDMKWKRYRVNGAQRPEWSNYQTFNKQSNTSFFWIPRRKQIFAKNHTLVNGWNKEY